MSLGDAWGSEQPPQDASVFSMDYYRNKALEFQQTLNALDTAYRAADAALSSQATDMDTAEYLSNWIATFLEKRDQFRLAAEAINAAASGVNAAGGRFPVMSIPQTLGLAPALVPVAIAGIIGVTATLITWGTVAISGLNERLKRAQLLDSASPAQKAQLVAAMSDSDESVKQSQATALSSLAPIVKYGAFALAAWLAYKAYKGMQ